VNSGVVVLGVYEPDVFVLLSFCLQMTTGWHPIRFTFWKKM